MNNELDFRKYLVLIGKRKGLFTAISLGVMTIAVILSYALPKKYEATSTVFIEKSVISDLVKGIAVTPSIEDKIKVLKYALSSRTLITKVVDELDLNVKKSGEAKLEETIKDLQKNTDIKIKDKEGLFIISFTDKNPRIARDYVNTLVRRYIEDNVSSKREESYGASKFLGEQISSFKEKMDKAEDAVNRFKQANATLLAADEGRLMQENAAAAQKLDELRIRRSAIEAQRNILKKGDPLQKRMQELKKHLDNLRVEYTDNYPEVLKVKSEIEALQDQIQKRPKGGDYSAADTSELERLNVEIQALRSAEDSQRRIVNGNQGLLRGIPNARASLEDLLRERNNQKGLYEQLVARHGQSEVSKQVEVQDKSTTFRIVDPAVMPIIPVSPDRVKIIIGGIVLGLAAGIGIIFLLDQTSTAMKTPESLKEFKIPVLAVIPTILNPEELLQRQRRDRKVFIFGGVYFCLILAVLAREIARKLI